MLDLNSIQPLFPQETVQQKIKELALDIFRDYDARQETFSLIYIEKGAKIFADVLMREFSTLDNPKICQGISSITARRTTGTGFLGELQLGNFDSQKIKNKNILLVEDIIDQGITLDAVLKRIRQVANSCRICVLIDKVEHRKKKIKLDYVGFHVEKGWVIGMGMDVDEQGRDLPFIGIIEGTA